MKQGSASWCQGAHIDENKREFYQCKNLRCNTHDLSDNGLFSARAENIDAEAADLIVYGTIYTAEEENDRLVEAFAVKDGRYIYVGDKEGAERYIQEGKTEVLDRTGEGLIFPGYTEGHSHYFSGTGLNSQLPGSGESYEEVLKPLKNR